MTHRRASVFSSPERQAAQQAAAAWDARARRSEAEQLQDAGQAIRAARLRVEHDLRELVVMMFKSATQARGPAGSADEPPALFTAGGRFFR